MTEPSDPLIRRRSQVIALCLGASIVGAACGFPRPAPIGQCDQSAGACVGTGADAALDAEVRIIDGSPIDAKPAAPAVSCLAIPHVCGVNSDDDCCAALEVPGGAYFRSFDPAGDHWSGNKNYPATVSAFRLDKYEVTVGRFRAFVSGGQGTQANPPATGAGAHPRIAGSGWQAAWTSALTADATAFAAALKCGQTHQTWTDVPGPLETSPINCITWYEAMAFCIWDGGRLPTESEWNYAAAGGDEQRAYPWSVPPAAVTIDHTRAAYHCTASACGDKIVSVGKTPAGDGRWGQSDLGGNVQEWVMDWFADPYLNPCNDCANLKPATWIPYRGGAFNDDPDVLRTGNRNNIDAPYRRLERTGVRCARSAL